MDIRKDSIADIKVTDVIDIEVLQKFLDNFAIGMNIASVAVNINGEPITKPSSYTRICANYTHSTKIGDDRCAESHRKGGEEAVRTGKPYIFRCHSGLIDFAAPIMIDGIQIGTILGGQILTAQPDENAFRKTAQEIGVNGDQYVAAVKEVKIMEEKNVKAAAEVLFIVANALSQVGYQNLKIKNTTGDLLESFSQISATMEELAASSVTVNENQENLNREILHIKEISEQIIKILASIKSIADQTKLIGLNASIEAARAGEAGKVFSVVASEIRNMSQNSKETAVNIEKLAADIQASIGKTLNISNSTMENVEQQSAGIQETTASVEEVLSLTNELYQMTNEK
jgi:Predicted sensor domain